MHWAASAEASSQYSTKDWSPKQSTGEPDIYPEYGDIKKAWAPSGPDSGTEWLELTYATPVYPTRVEVYETYNPGTIVQVEVGSPDGTWYTVWTGAATPAEEIARIVTYDVDLQVLVDKVRLTLDTAKVPGWNEIDATALVGAALKQVGSQQEAAQQTVSSQVPAPEPPQPAHPQQEVTQTPPPDGRQSPSDVTVTANVPHPIGGSEQNTASSPATTSDTLVVIQSPTEITEPLLLPPPPLSFEEKLAAIDAHYEADIDAQVAVIESLAVLGASGVSQLIPYLTHTNNDIVVAALDTLGEIGPNAKAAGPHLGSLLTHLDRSVRSAAVSAIEEIGITDEGLSLAVQQYVIQTPSSEYSSLRHALAALNESGLAPQKETIAGLVDIIDLTDYAGGADLRGFLAKGGDVTAQALIPMIQNGQANQKVTAANFLVTIGPSGAIALPALINGCQDADVNVRRRMVSALAYVAPDDPQVATTLLGVLNDANEDVVYEAAVGLSRIAYQDEAIIEAILTYIQKYLDKSRIANPLASAAAKYGAPIVPKVEQWLQSDPGYQTGIRAAGALGSLGVPFIPRLTLLYAKADTETKTNIITALGNIGHADAYPLLEQAAGAPESQIRRGAARALAKLPDPTPEVIDTLVKLIGDGNYATAQAAVQALGDIGAPALDKAVAKLASDNTQERALGTAILSEMGIAAAPAIPALYELLLKETDENLKAAYNQLLFDIWKLPDVNIPEQNIVTAVNLADLAATDWQLAVITAKELVRMIMGPMEDEETVLFEQQWEPMFKYPSMELVDYFIELNPLLNEFLATRAAFVETGYNYQNALSDAWAALSFADQNAHWKERCFRSATVRSRCWACRSNLPPSVKN